jgi:recombination protein RecA
MMPITVRLASASAEAPADDHTLHAALGQLSYRFGPSIAGCPDEAPPVAAISTGNPALDLAIGVGGVPRGRLTEVYGPDGAGKTTLALSVIAQAQQAGGTACFIDAEHALDLAWAATIGVDLERLVLCRPEYGEQALEVAAVPPRIRRAGPGGGRRAGRLRSAGRAGDRLHRRAGAKGRAGRGDGGAPRGRAGQPAQPGAPQALRPDRQGSDGGGGDQPAPPAGRDSRHAGLHQWGRALGYYASLRLDLRPLGQLRDGGEVVGSRVRVQVTKNKVAPAFKVAELEVRSDRGVLAEASAEAASA